MQALAREIGRYCVRFVLFYWICFAFPFPLDLVGLPFQLVEPTRSARLDEDCRREVRRGVFVD